MNFKGWVDDFGAVLGTAAKQIEAKDQYKKFRNKIKNDVLRELQNTEDIIVLIQDLKYPMTVMYKSVPTSLSTQDEKDSIMVMIQTKEIKNMLKIGLH